MSSSGQSAIPPSDWAQVLEDYEVDVRRLESDLDIMYYNYEVFPERSRLFRALTLTALPEVRVVVLGQDPYSDRGLADGLAFSVRKKAAIPPSLANIFRAIAADPKLNATPPRDGSLARWARQGVLLLNCALTVEKNQPGSHLSYWQRFTVAVLAALQDQRAPIVFLLFGEAAVRCGELAELSAPHTVIEMAHPVAWAHTNLPKVAEAHPFSKTNAILASAGRGQIDW